MNIAVLGLGNVGKPFYDIIIKKDNKIFSDCDISIKYVLVRNVNNKNIDKSKLVTDFNIILNDESIDCVIELMGSNISYEYIKKSLLAKKHVITANKEVIANHYIELLSIAKDNNVNLLFEAAVGGGIPIVHSLNNSASYNNIYKIEGILNGTTNYILTSMHKDHISFDEALKNAQIKGFAEADPTSDLLGLDMVRKISILSMICYETAVDLNNVYHYGVNNITKEITETVELLGYKTKFMATSILKNNNVNIFVEPVLLKETDIVSNVDYEYNIVRYHGDNCGTQTMYGKGAGPITANAVAFDLNLLLRGYKNLNITKNYYKTLGKTGIKAKYFIVLKKNIKLDFIEKKMNNIIITKEIDAYNIDKIKDNIEFYARIVD